MNVVGCILRAQTYRIGLQSGTFCCACELNRGIGELVSGGCKLAGRRHDGAFEIPAQALDRFPTVTFTCFYIDGKREIHIEHGRLDDCGAEALVLLTGFLVETLPCLASGDRVAQSANQEAVSANIPARFKAEFIVHFANGRHGAHVVFIETTVEDNTPMPDLGRLRMCDMGIIPEEAFCLRKLADMVVEPVENFGHNCQNPISVIA